MSESKRDMATKIVNDLFWTGCGKYADRLVLEKDGKFLGGWCKEAMIDRITEKLEGL